MFALEVAIKLLSSNVLVITAVKCEYCLIYQSRTKGAGFQDNSRHLITKKNNQINGKLKSLGQHIEMTPLGVFDPV